MAKTKKELANILNALTGETHDESEFKSKAEIIGEISKHTSGGGGGGGGESDFYNITATMESGDTVTLDKSYSEINAAITAGKMPIIDIMGFKIPFTGNLVDGNETILVFSSATLIESNSSGYVVITLDDTDTVTVDSNDFIDSTYVETAVAPFVVTFTASDLEDITISSADKTYQEVAAAVAAFRERTVNRIILTRPAVEAGERLGFLPGDLQNSGRYRRRNGNDF